METEALIRMLAHEPRAPSRGAVAKRMGRGTALSLAAALLMLVFVIPGGVDSTTLMARISTPVFWVKLMLPLSMLVASLRVAARLSRPGVRVGQAWTTLALPVALVWIAAIAVLAFAPDSARSALIFGHTWNTCSLHIALLSIPALAVLQFAMRGLAPTRPALAGAAAGLLAGSIGALTYCLRCPEMEVPFWATWYLLGMLLPTLVGVLTGPRVLRW